MTIVVVIDGGSGRNVAVIVDAIGVADQSSCILVGWFTEAQAVLVLVLLLVLRVRLLLVGSRRMGR